uniref:Uncharacterized protein n=1 Tax=Nicotiana tabacum TaxID=4097 RepID=A0A1S4D1J8_TOBAC|nr:PREDICTED: uncharacterized protein LOC107824846 [Nicotiana tabacum]
MKGSEFEMVVQLMHSVLDTDSYYEVNSTNLVWDWRNAIIDYLEHGKLPNDSKASQALRVKAARLEAAKGKWPEELPGFLWAYRTVAKSSTGETPFSLVYGTEALIPVEVGEPILRYFQASEKANNEAMLVNLELLDERRDLARVRMAAQKQRMKRYYN